MRLILFGSGERAIASLLRLTDEDETPVGVVTTAGDMGISLGSVARKLGISVLAPDNVNSPGFLAEISELHPECNLSISYDQIFRSPLIEMPPLGFVNFHPGKLPYYRGRSTINWAIINGETEVGITAHYVDVGIDTGDIILQRTLPIGRADYYSDVLQSIDEAFPDLVTDTIKLISEGRVGRKPQSPYSGTYYCRRESGDEWLDWSDTSLRLYNKIRGISEPGPGAYTLVNDRLVVIWRASYDTKWPCYAATPGQVVGRGFGEGVLVKTGDSTLMVQSVQYKDDEKKVPNWGIGTRLGFNVPNYVINLRTELERLQQQVNNLSNSGNLTNID